MYRMQAMPSLCDSTDFGLSNKYFNRKTGLNYLRHNPNLVKVLSTNTNLYQVEDKGNGFYFTWNTEKQLITYFMHYKMLNKKLINTPSITQTALWRMHLDGATKGLTYEMIFKVLLHKYPAILSDKLQTDDGRDFWIGLMDYALVKSYKVGLVDFNNSKVLPISSNAALRLWLTDASATCAWSYNSLKHQGLRFVIYRK